MTLRLAGVALALLFFLPIHGQAQFGGAATKKPLLPPVSRAEAISTLLNARLGSVPQPSSSRNFGDIPPYSWYRDAMIVGEQYGIVAADAEAKLRPEEPVTRAEFLKMITMTFGLSQNMTHRYRDVSVTEWYATYAGLAERYQLFPLDTDQRTLQPMKFVTREEAANIVSLFVKDKEKTLAYEKDKAAQSGTNPQLYSVISTMRQSVKLVWPDQARDVQVVPPKEPPSLDDIRQEILAMVNRVRAENGLKPVMLNAKLQESAQDYAREMAIGGFFSHISPTGTTLKQRAEAVGYYQLKDDPSCNCTRGIEIGENLGRGQVTAAQVMEDWLASSSHRQTILTATYTDIGIGEFAGYWVEHFGGMIEIPR